MTKTENFALNQWDAADPIRREDFNADNQKIDAALAENPCVKLLDMTLTEAQNRVDLDISAQDLSQYQRLELYITGNASAYAAVDVRLNGRTSDYYYHSSSTYSDRSELLSFAMTAQPGGALFALYFFGAQILGTICGAAWNGNTVYFNDSQGSIKSNVLAVEDIQTINLITNSESIFLQPGTRITLTAFKK